MLIKLSNDDSRVSNIDKRSVEKVLSVTAISAKQSQQENGNNLPERAAIPDTSIGLQKAGETDKLEDAIRKINQSIQVTQRELHFSVDKNSGETVIKVMDLATKEVIRQIPNKEALNVARMLEEGVDLKLFSEYS